MIPLTGSGCALAVGLITTPLIYPVEDTDVPSIQLVPRPKGDNQKGTIHVIRPWTLLKPNVPVVIFEGDKKIGVVSRKTRLVWETTAGVKNIYGKSGRIETCFRWETSCRERRSKDQMNPSENNFWPTLGDTKIKKIDVQPGKSYFLLLDMNIFSSNELKDITYGEAKEFGNVKKPATPDSRIPFYLGISYGDFSIKETPEKFRKIGRGDGWGLTAGYYLNNYLSVESDFSHFITDIERKSDTIIPGTANNNIRVSSSGFSVGAKASYPLWKLRPFVGGGVGIFLTGLATTSPSSPQLFGGGPSPSHKSSRGHYFLAGIGSKLWDLFYLDLVWKRTAFNISFQEFTNGQVESGGDWFYISFRYGGTNIT